MNYGGFRALYRIHICLSFVCYLAPVTFTAASEHGGPTAVVDLKIPGVAEGKEVADPDSPPGRRCGADLYVGGKHVKCTLVTHGLSGTREDITITASGPFVVGKTLKGPRTSFLTVSNAGATFYIFPGSNLGKGFLKASYARPLAAAGTVRDVVQIDVGVVPNANAPFQAIEDGLH